MGLECKIYLEDIMGLEFYEIVKKVVGNHGP